MKFNPKKSLGQNFLTDKNILKKIVDVGNISEKDKILEIGPGTGNLTTYIIESEPKHIIVVEKDIELIKILEKKFKKEIQIVHEDVLKLTKDFYYDKFIVYGNLPYNISTKILSNWCLNKEIKFKKLILMFQKEVADRIIANTNTKNYGRLAIISQWCMNIQKLKNVKPKSFYPIPKVESTLLSFEPKKNYFMLNNAKNLEHVTNIFFNLKRKMIKKPISILFDDVDKISKRLNLNLNERPQNLSPNTFYKICCEYEKLLS